MVVWPSDLMLVSFALGDLAKVVAGVGSSLTGFSVLLVERDEVSLTIDQSAWTASRLGAMARAVAGPYRAITLDLTIDLSVCGYLLPAAERLAEAGISIVPQCGYQKDHLLVRSADAPEAAALITSLIEEAKARPETGWRSP